LVGFPVSRVLRGEGRVPAWHETRGASFEVGARHPQRPARQCCAIPHWRAVLGPGHGYARASNPGRRAPASAVHRHGAHSARAERRRATHRRARANAIREPGASRHRFPGSIRGPGTAACETTRSSDSAHSQIAGLRNRARPVARSGALGHTLGRRSASPRAELPMTSLLQKIETRSARVVVLGIGYVGLPLAVEFARAGFRTTGLDVDSEKVRLLNAGESYLSDVATGDVARHVSARRLDASADSGILREADVVVVCVPTPLNKTKDPDMRFILAATDEIARHQHDDMLVILESTTYPGATTEVLVPKLTERGAVLGHSVFIAFSPERVDPGNRVYKTKNTPKVLGGASPTCLAIASALYSRILDQIVPVSSTETAEMVKLLENTFRAVNIGLVNEIAMMSRKLGIDPF